MLPAHLSLTECSPSKSTNPRLGAPPPPPSLCITGAMCSMGRLEVRGGGVLAYSVFRPRQLKDTRRPPLLVIHGGPGIPSNYLLPLVNVVSQASASRCSKCKYKKLGTNYAILIFVLSLAIIIPFDFRSQIDPSSSTINWDVDVPVDRRRVKHSASQIPSIISRQS